jgi:hypothetical protein
LPNLKVLVLLPRLDVVLKRVDRLYFLLWKEPQRSRKQQPRSDAKGVDGQPIYGFRPMLSPNVVEENERLDHVGSH